MSLLMIMILVFISTTLITYSILWFPNRNKTVVTDRMREYQKRASQGFRDSDFPTGLPGIKTSVNRNISKIVTRLNAFSRDKESENEALRASLLQAGFYKENSVRIFRSLRIATPVVLLVVGLVIGVMGQGKNPAVMLFALILPAIGYLLPGVVLRKLIKRRQEQIASGLADALDFLVICVEAGLGLNSAIIRVGQELQLRSRALGEELLLVNRDMRAGITREQALRNLCERNQTKDLKVVVGSLLLADKLGTSIADTLRAQSDSLRTRVRQRAEEQAAKASVKMLFPLIFLILPALFIILLGPGILLALRAMGPMGQ